MTSLLEVFNVIVRFFVVFENSCVAFASMVSGREAMITHHAL